jgi:hypothetical protein
MAAVIAGVIPHGAHGADRTARVDCRTASEANFPNAYSDPNNLVVGPLAMIGAGAPTSAETVAKFGGQKFPLLVRSGHTVTLRVLPSVQDAAALAYGPLLPQGRVTVLRDGFQSETFVACEAAQSKSSTAAGPVTFWSGAVLANRPVCVPLDVYVDEREPEHVAISLGRPCPPTPPARKRTTT